MSNKKGFDPLSSLFDLPETPAPPPSKPAPPAQGDALPEPPHVRPTPPAVPAGPDPVALAKILAKVAAAKAAAKAAPAPAVPAPAKPKSASKPAAPAPAASPMSRLMAAPPPKRAVSAEEAMRAAAEAEARRQAEAAEARKAPPPPAPVAEPAPAFAASPTLSPDQESAPRGDLTDVVTGILQDGLPSVGSVYVAKALVMDDRGVLTALWRAHRNRFLSMGDLAGAVSVNAVLRALAGARPGQLVAAHAITDKSDWLVWIDLSNSTLIAAFRDARAWFAS